MLSKHEQSKVRQPSITVALTSRCYSGPLPVVIRECKHAEVHLLPLCAPEWVMNVASQYITQHIRIGPNEHAYWSASLVLLGSCWALICILSLQRVSHDVQKLPRSIRVLLEVEFSMFAREVAHHDEGLLAACGGTIDLLLGSDLVYSSGYLMTPDLDANPIHLPNLSNSTHVVFWPPRSTSAPPGLVCLVLARVCVFADSCGIKSHCWTEVTYLTNLESAFVASTLLQLPHLLHLKHQLRQL